MSVRPSPDRLGGEQPAVQLIGYGSLMSGLGLATVERLEVLDAARVRLRNCRRGFGKLSRFGDRYAMALDPVRSGEPIVAQAANEGADGIDALALTLPLDAFRRIAAREGYRPEAIDLLVEQAGEDGMSLPSFLWRVLEAASFDHARYRGRLFELTGFTSAHYIPHPVAVGGGSPAITFLAPGREGSGCDAVVPIRVATGMTTLLSLQEAWDLKPNASQIEYFVMCLLAAVHGISLGDLLDDVEEDASLAPLLGDRLDAERPREGERFMTLLGLDPERYRARFYTGEPPRRGEAR